MKRELICNKAIWRAKKNYIVSVWDSEGVRYKEPRIIMKGIEAIRSSTPMICRESIKKSIKIIMNDTEEALQKYVSDFEKEFFTQPFDVVAFPRTANDVVKYADKTKSIPAHIKGALTHNKMLKERNLTKQYQQIRDRDKIRWMYLKEPNPFHSHIIGATDELPKEFNIESYLDYKTQFEKSFLNPIESITSVIGWKTKKVPTLLGFLKKNMED